MSVKTNEVTHRTLEGVIAEFARYPRQAIYPADAPHMLRLGWRIENPPVRVTVRAKATVSWPSDVRKLLEDEQGRETLLTLIANKAWSS